jgi:hypothetical protein
LQQYRFAVKEFCIKSKIRPSFLNMQHSDMQEFIVGYCLECHQAKHFRVLFPISPMSAAFSSFDEEEEQYQQAPSFIQGFDQDPAAVKRFAFLIISHHGHKKKRSKRWRGGGTDSVILALSSQLMLQRCFVQKL